MTTVAELVDDGAARIAASGSSSARLDAQLLLAHVLEIDRTGVLAHPTAPVGDSSAALYEDAVARRVDGEPVAYIVGVREFRGLAFSVDSRTLVPRPETEILVALAIDDVIGRLTSDPRPAGGPRLRVVDIGTGSGVIAISIAAALRRRGMASELDLSATDISADAIRSATENAVGHGVADRIAFYETDLLPPLADTAWDVIVANLPYVATDDIDAAGAMLGHEPREALDGGPDGTAVLARLIADLPRGLARRGTAYIEIGAGQEAAVSAMIAAALPGVACVVEPDLAGVPRVVIVGPRD